MGLEPTTFSLQGNCAPNCATAPNQTTVIIEVSVSDLFVLHNSSLRLASERTRAKLSCATIPQAVVYLMRPTLTLFPLLIWRCFCRANRDGHPTGTRTRICTLKGCRPRPVRRWDDKAGFYLSLHGRCVFNRHNRSWEYPNPPGWTRPMGSEPIVKLLFLVAEPAQ